MRSSTDSADRKTGQNFWVQELLLHLPKKVSNYKLNQSYTGKIQEMKNQIKLKIHEDKWHAAACNFFCQNHFVHSHSVYKHKIIWKIEIDPIGTMMLLKLGNLFLPLKGREFIGLVSQKNLDTMSWLCFAQSSNQYISYSIMKSIPK